MPYGQQTRENFSGSFNHSIPPPSYNPPVDSHGPPTPGSSTPDIYNPNSNPMSPSTPGSAPPPFMAVCPPGPVPTPGTPPVVTPLTEKEKKKGVPDWMVMKRYFLEID